MWMVPLSRSTGFPDATLICAPLPTLTLPLNPPEYNISELLVLLRSMRVAGFWQLASMPLNPRVFALVTVICGTLAAMVTPFHSPYVLPPDQLTVRLNGPEISEPLAKSQRAEPPMVVLAAIVM